MEPILFTQPLIETLSYPKCILKFKIDIHHNVSELNINLRNANIITQAIEFKKIRKLLNKFATIPAGTSNIKFTKPIPTAAMLHELKSDFEVYSCQLEKDGFWYADSKELYGTN